MFCTFGEILNLDMSPVHNGLLYSLQVRYILLFMFVGSLAPVLKTGTTYCILCLTQSGNLLEVYFLTWID